MHIAIIGNGIAGVTAARHLRKRDRDVQITLISAESEYHWSRPSLMYVYMGHLRFEHTKPYEDRFWADNRIDRLRGWVRRIDTDSRTLHLDGDRTLRFDRLLLATGSVPNRFGWPGQDLQRVGGLYSLQDLQALEQATPQIERGVIVGGGLIGIELAEMLHSRGLQATLLVREASYWNNVLPAEESALVNHWIRAAGLDLRLSTELDTIEDDGRGGVGAVLTRSGERIACQYVGLTAGVRPNIAVCEGSAVQTGRGILVDDTLQTSCEGIYAAGDCAEVQRPEGERNLIQAVWYTGRAMGEVVAANLLGERQPYQPGTWFNSAKFLDLEHQVYGEVPSALRDDPSVRSVYWEHPSKRHSVRICTRDGAVTGFNLMGVRYRQEVCTRWIEEGRPLPYVLDNLRQASFDPEFSRRHERDIRRAAQELA